MALPGNSSLPLLYYFSGNPTNVSTAIINPPLGSLVIDYVTPSLWVKTTAQGDNSGYAGGAGGTLSAPVISGGLTASGSASNNFSGSTGTFLTSSGLTTISGGLGSTPQLLTGAGAVNLTSLVTEIVSTGANALTLADGTNGQIKILVMKTDGGDATLTPTTKTGYTTATFNDAGDGLILVFTTTTGWIVAGNNGVTLA